MCFLEYFQPALVASAVSALLFWRQLCLTSHPPVTPHKMVQQVGQSSEFPLPPPAGRPLALFRGWRNCPLPKMSYNEGFCSSKSTSTNNICSLHDGTWMLCTGGKRHSELPSNLFLSITCWFGTWSYSLALSIRGCGVESDIERFTKQKARNR